MPVQHKIYAATLAVCSAAVLTLAGCGGGGNDSPAPVTPPSTPADNPDDSGDSSGNTPAPAPAPGAASSIAGAWYGTGANGSRTQSTRMFILDDGSLWGVIVSGDSAIGTSFQNLFHGTSSANGNRVSASFTQFDAFTTAPATTGRSFSGSLVDPTDLNLAFDSGLSVPVKQDDSYNAPASPSALAASYSGQFAIWGSNTYRQSRPTLTVSGSALSLSADRDGCSASGTLAPHSTANGTPLSVFDLSLTFSGTSCALGDGTTVKGIAYPFNNGANFEALATTPDGKYAILFEAAPQ